MRVKYIGPNVKTDSIAGIGLRWEPGQVREVTGTVADILLTYSDTWQKDDSEAPDEGEPIDLRKAEKEDEPLEVVNFHAMNKDQLVKFAFENWNEKFDKRQKVDFIREQVINRHSQKQMESSK